MKSDGSSDEAEGIDTSQYLSEYATITMDSTSDGE
jgi:hypothetical protein